MRLFTWCLDDHDNLGRDIDEDFKDYEESKSNGNCLF